MIDVPRSGLLVQTANRRPLVLDQPLEVLKAPGGIPLKTGGDVVPATELRLELVDRVRVPLTGRGPLFQDVGAAFDEIGQVLFGRVRRLSGVRASVEHGVEAIEVRLEISQA